MITNGFRRLFSSSNIKDSNPLSQEYIQYFESSYPSNHTYKIIDGQFYPKRKLASRYKTIRQYFPEKMTSFAEIGSSKGFFVFSASQLPHCTRALGIDVNSYDIEMCQWLKGRLQNPRVSFAKLRLHELGERIHEFGGPFQTVLLLNTYQYLYFGSDACGDAYFNHDLIFSNLRKICSQRIIFNNRIALADCQNTEKINQAGYHSQNYSEEAIQKAAAKYFTITERGKYGRYPLWTLEARD